MEINYSGLSNTEADRQAIENLKEIVGPEHFGAIVDCVKVCETSTQIEVLLALAPAAFGCFGRCLFALLRLHQPEAWQAFLDATGIRHEAGHPVE